MAEPTPKQISDYYAKNGLNRDQRGMGGMLLRDMPGTPHHSAEQTLRYELQNKPASAASSAPPTALTPEQRQANIARDLALSQTRGARPSGQDSQFYQPVFQSQYQNYANPLTALNVSNYGTNPGMSQSMQAATAPGAGGIGPYLRQLQSYANLLSTQGDRNNINTLMQDMRTYGINAQDLQAASSYSPFSYQQPMQQRQAPFNPYTNQYQMPFNYQQPMQQQMQTPFSYQQPMQQPAAQPNYGPSQAIVGRSSQMRGTPNVMRRAEGGITSLLNKSK
jgi:hypothetical protein